MELYTYDYVGLYTYYLLLRALQFQSSYSEIFLTPPAGKLCIAFLLQVSHLMAGIQREVVDREL